jgi:hypothetical protein
VGRRSTFWCGRCWGSLLPLDGNGGIDVASYGIHDRYDFNIGKLTGWTQLRITGTTTTSGSPWISCCP